VKLTILGCGTSSGVPRIGNDWGSCDSNEPRNRRTRVSILVETNNARVLIDTGPDLREQLLRADVAALDAVIWTHDHADHCHGIDDLRQVFHARGSPVPAYARKQTLDVLKGRFGYVFEGRGGYPPSVAASILLDRLVISDLTIDVVDQPHGRITSTGLRFTSGGRSIGYATDFNLFTDGMRTHYQSLDVWIVDALRRAPHPTHPTVDQAIGWAREIAPKRTLLTHMDQSMDYRTLLAELPEGIEPAYDGLEIVL
jgi:phosphoribosyl 1,2-cyclic phosphate phosphodiesterase